MGEVAGEYLTEEFPLPATPDPDTMKSPLPLLQVITISSGSIREENITITTTRTTSNKSSNDSVGSNPFDHHQGNPQEAWLPITESRNGSIHTCVFHLLSSGIGFQALLLPAAFAILGWTWGIISLSLAFAWQLYTTWLLVHLHESVPGGTRYSRYLQLAIASFGPKLGKVLALFPVMYLSGGTCVMLIITGGGTMKLFFKLMCEGDGTTCDFKSPTGAEWFLVFTCMAILLSQRPNLNSIAGISLIGAITAVVYCTLIWVLSISKGRPDGVSYDTSLEATSDMARMSGIMSALGTIVLAFRGHNLVLEVQGTLPSRSKIPTKRPMWRGVTISYVIVALCLYPLAIGGFWAYGNKVPSIGGLLTSFYQFHSHDTSKFAKGLIYLMVVVNCVSSFQIYAMPVFDNLELRYTSIKKQRCPWWVRTGLRLFFGGLAFLIAVAFPFLPSLAPLIGGIASPLTFAYPCFMWISIKKPRRNSPMWCLNMGLGCSGMGLSVLLVVSAVWNLTTKGLNANFFNP